MALASGAVELCIGSGENCIPDGLLSAGKVATTEPLLNLVDELAGTARA